MRMLDLRLAGLMLMLGGCASQTVPALSADQFTKPELVNLKPRELALTVVDARNVSNEDKAATAANIRETLQALLESSGIKVSESASNTLTVRMTYPEKPPMNVERESCVEFDMELVGLVEPVELRGVGCAALQNAVGMSMGSDINKAFGMALEQILVELDRRANKTAKLAEAPTFDANMIVVPGFLKVSKLTLEVIDTWSEDNRVGQSLQRELGKALQAAGVELGLRKANKLTITVSKPTEGIADRNPEGCLHLAAKGNFAKGAVVGKMTGCHGQDEPIQHQLLNDMLTMMDEQYGD